MSPKPPAATDTFVGRTARAAQWRFAGAAVGAVSQFGIGVLLARLLAPADFGLMAVAFAVLGLVRPLTDLGLGSAVVQRSDLRREHVQAAFTVAALSGCVIALAVLAAAPLGAVWMGNARVTPILRVLAIGFVVQGFGVVANALLRRALNFRLQFFIDTLSYLVGYGTVAILLALRGYGVWSLVWGGLAQTTLASSLAAIAVRHSMRPRLAVDELRELLHFGVGSAAILVVNQVALGGDNLVVGRFLGVSALGFYSRAYALMNLPFSYCAGVMSGVLFPAFASVQRDRERLRRAYFLTTQLTAVIAASAMASLAIAAPHLIPAVYGARWAGVVPPVTVLCIAGYFRALYHLGGIVAQSAGMVYGELKQQIVYASLVVGGAWLGLGYGLVGVAAGVDLAIVYMFIASGRLALKATGGSWTSYLRVQTVAVITGGAVLAAAGCTRWVLEARGAPAPAAAAAILCASAIPFAAGLSWTLAVARGAEMLHARAGKGRSEIATSVGAGGVKTGVGLF
jgi:O-antigen/teichoic acid export membrane protein